MNFSLNPFMWVRGEVAGNTTVGDYEVDTCDTMDCGFETAIRKKEGDWIVVEYYRNMEEAKKGHDKWCEFCKGNPAKVYSVQIEEVEEF